MRRFTTAAVGGAALSLLVTGAAAAQTTITLATYVGATTNLTNWQAVAAAFTKSHPDIQVQVQLYPFGDYIDKITSMSAAGAPPDVFQTWAQYKENWAENGLIADVTELWNTSKVITGQRIYPFMRDSAAYHGRYYGVPFDYNSEVWFLDGDLLSAAGLSDPSEHWTTDDLRAMAKKLTRPETKIFGAANPVRGGNGDNIQWMKNWSGHGWLNADRTKVLVDDTKSAEMLQYWVDNTYALGVTAAPGVAVAKNAMYQGYISYMFGYVKNTPEFNWRLATYPAPPGGTQKDFAQGHMFSVPAHSAHPQEGRAFLEWMMSPAGQEAIVKYLQREPITPTPELWSEFYNQLPAERVDYVRRWMTDVLYGPQAFADTFAYWPSYGKMNSIMRTHLTNVFSKQKPVVTEMKQAAVEMQAALDE